MKTKLKTIVIVTIVISVLLYLLFSFYWLSFNATEWNNDARALLCVLVVMTGIFATLFNTEL